MRILHTADWHLGHRLQGHYRHDEQAAVLDELCHIADDQQIDAVVIAGDVFDAYNPPTESESLFYRTMTRLSNGGRRAVIVIAGNHDSPDRLLASDPYARALGIVTVGLPKDAPLPFDGGTELVSCLQTAPSFVRLRTPRQGRVLSVLALPYPSESRLREVLTHDLSDEEAEMTNYNRRIKEFMEETARLFADGGANIITSHLFVGGGMESESESERKIQIGGAYVVDRQSFPASAGYVALGHLHRPQEQHGQDDLPIRYSGSILQYSMSEAGQQKSVTVVEFGSDGKASYHNIPLTAGRGLARLHVESIAELEAKIAETDPQLWVDIVLRLQEPLGIDYSRQLRAAHPNILGFIPQYQLADAEAEAISINNLSPQEQFRRFVEQKHGEPVGDEVMKLFLELVATEQEDEQLEE
ncbi:MAG: exonuclease SbcCD subunit D [Armatimonadetes bacterium]|nr:exonuclease SbcCD subunit D [Armatimonadota bacterium]